MTFPQLAAIVLAAAALCARFPCCWSRSRWRPVAVRTAQSYRPIFARPAPATAPCTHLRRVATAVVTEEPVSAPTSTVPSLGGPSVDSDVPTPSSSLQGSSGTDPHSTAEPPPSREDRDRAGIRRNPIVRRHRQRNSTKPPAGTGQRSRDRRRPCKARTPVLASRLEPGSPRAQRINAAASPTSRRTGLGDRLQPFVAGSSASELFYPNKADRPWRYIVLHHSASASGNYDQIDQRAPQDPGI